MLGKQAFNYLSKRTASEAVHKRDEMLCATFSTPKNVDAAFNAYSLIIPYDLKSQEDIERCLLEVQTFKLAKQSLLQNCFYNYVNNIF